MQRPSPFSFQSFHHLRLFQAERNLWFLEKIQKIHLWDNSYKNLQNCLTWQEENQESANDWNCSKNYWWHPVKCFRKASCNEWRDHRANSCNQRCETNGNVADDSWKQFATVQIHSREGNAPKRVKTLVKDI